MSKVLVLMTTYNGEKYLNEQIQSILDQDYSEIDILIRDDGSSDGTIELLKAYSEKYENIQYYAGDNLGACQSFFDLIEKAQGEYEYFAFSDQDDFWLPQKISKAIDFLAKANSDELNLYCSNVTLVDEKLQKLPSIVRNGKIRPSFGNALIEDICTGCTCVMNAKLFYNIKDHIPRYAIMHDWWFYLVATCFGTVYYDENSYILYRQHSNNVIGVPSNYLNLYIRRVLNLGKRKHQIIKQVSELDDLYNHTESVKELVSNIRKSANSMIARFKIANNAMIYRQNRMDDFLFKVMIILYGC